MNRVMTPTLAVTLLLFSVRLVPVDPITVVLEAENYADISLPMRTVRCATASAGAFICLASGSGQGWRGEGKGSVAYRLDLPRSGRYVVWGRTEWLDPCRNAFFLSANGQAPIVFGNDPIFNRWHWVRAVPLGLDRGVNHLRFSNHSDGTALDKLIVTEDSDYVPEGLGEEITQFYDGFAGCDTDNTGSWEFLAGKWKVVPSVGDTSAGANDVLAQWNPDGGEAVGGFRVWERYDAKTSLMATSPGSIGLIFFRRQSDDEWRVFIEFGEGKSEIGVLRSEGGQTVLLGSKPLAGLSFDKWYDLAFRVEGDRLKVLLDGEEAIEVPSPDGQSGCIGLFCRGQTGAYFDNVEVRFRRKDPGDA